MNNVFATIAVVALVGAGALLGLWFDRLPPTRIGFPPPGPGLDLPPSLAYRLAQETARAEGAEGRLRACEAAERLRSEAVEKLAAESAARLLEAQRRLAEAQSGRAAAERAVADLRAEPISGSSECERWGSSWASVQRALNAAGGASR